MRPLATDLSPGDFIQLGWVRFRSGSGGSVHCRLGGDPEYVGSNAVLKSSEDNRGVISMFLGVSAPQPPTTGVECLPAGVRDRQHAVPPLSRTYVSADLVLFSAAGLSAAFESPPSVFAAPSPSPPDSTLRFLRP